MDKMKIEEVQSTAKKQRIATHTHIKGLGLDVITPSLSFFLNFCFSLNALPFHLFLLYFCNCEHFEVSFVLAMGSSLFF